LRITAAGTDAAIAIVYDTKGEIHSFRASNTENFRINVMPAAINYIIASPAASGGAVSMSIGGSGVDVDFLIAAKGAGNVRFGTFTANADAPITGYVTIKDTAGNVRKLAVIA
jgi:hypothetical protein